MKEWKSGTRLLDSGHAGRWDLTTTVDEKAGCSKLRRNSKKQFLGEYIETEHIMEYEIILL